MDPRAFVQAVADKAHGPPEIVYQEEFGSYTLTWANERLTAGLTADANGAWVFLAAAAQEVKTPEEAVQLLRAIFKDEMVCIAAVKDGLAQFYDLTPAADPTEEFVRLTGANLFQAPKIDSVWVTSWSGVGDYGDRPREPTDEEKAAWAEQAEELEEGAEGYDEEEPEAPEQPDWGPPIVT